MPGFYSELQTDATYLDIPERIDEEELERRVAALRLGDQLQVPLICVGLMRFTMSLVANYAHPRRTPDLIGTALLTLVEVVNDAAARLDDNNILPFVSTHISLRLKDMIASDHVVCIPPRTLRDWKRRGIEAFVPLTSTLVGLEGVARPEAPSLECMDSLAKIIRDDRDKLIVEMRSQAYGLKVIAEALGVSIGTVHNLKRELRERFLEANAD